jgi:hypothetical protein
MGRACLYVSAKGLCWKAVGVGYARDHIFQEDTQAVKSPECDNASGT